MTNIISGIRTFFKSELKDPSKKYSIVGIPFDGACTYKRGTAFAPSLIRDSSTMLCDGVDCETLYDVLSNVSDYGDVEYNFCLNDYTQNPLSKLNSNKLIVVGGDHSISKMSLQKAFVENGKFQLIHFDAHSDCWDGESNHGTFIRELNDANYFSNVVQIGIRSPAPKHVINYGIENNFKIFRPVDFDENVYTRIINSLTKDPTFITLDIDVLEPSYIGNGTGTPEPFGLNPIQLLKCLKMIIDNTSIIGFDITEVSEDQNKLCSQMAANLIWKYIAYSESKL